MNKPKVVITTVPFIDWNTPIAAPAYLTALLKKHNIDCVGLDLNIEIYNKIKNDPDRELYLKFFYEQEIHPRIYKNISTMLYHYVKKILEHKPSHVGLSLLTYCSQVFTVWLCHLLKKIQPQIKIIIGGAGLYTLANRKMSFPVGLKKDMVIDDFIVGDATKSVVDYFVHDQQIHNKSLIIAQQDPEFHNSVTPNFDNYDFFNYEHIKLPIVDSRGCVQNCEFCDVIEFWQKFQSLSAEVIFSQMLELIKKYNISRFDFASSISNGNLLQFKKLVKYMADFNSNKLPNEQIYWNGNFIVRKKGRHTEELWKDIKKSNGHLVCGVESLSSEARIKLGKNFTNDDLDDHLKQCKKHKIKIDVLIIASYPTETRKDYDDAYSWFEQYKQYAGNVITRVQMTIPAILDGTRLKKNTNIKKFIAERDKRKTHANALKEKAIECGFQVETYW